jgi:hypothetical protein
METSMTLFTGRSILTMLHGIVLGGGALIGLVAALFYLKAAPSPATSNTTPREERALSLLLVAVCAALWTAVIGGTYLVFGPYRATPPEGLIDLAAYPRSLILANPSTSWLHAVAMELKEHVPWSAAMIATALAFVASRRSPSLMRDAQTRRFATVLLSICILLVTTAALLGTFVNKVAPLE